MSVTYVPLAFEAESPVYMPSLARLARLVSNRFCYALYEEAVTPGQLQ